MTTDDTIDTLNDLIETCKDGEFGHRLSAEYARDAEVQQFLRQHSQRYSQAALDLQMLVAELGGMPQDSGTAAGSLHRGWVSLKSKLSSYTDLAILEDVERGEDSALQSYRRALEAGVTASARPLVEAQFEHVKHGHLQVRALRDSTRIALN
ncbi:MAG: PA2169 family four-helix-bundle protein [Chitinophagaceae bacterium]|nr:PA2169 family four-helix-bundle protein [Rubrivivax sp.]